MPVEQQARRETGWCRIRTSCEGKLAEHGLVTARDFLALPGIVVSGHVGRNVSRVQIGDWICYLKREHRMRFRDRWRSVFAVDKFTSLSEREAIVLRKLEESGCPVTNVLATGEANGQAFLLVDAAIGAQSLRDLPRVGNRLAQDLGQAIAKIHNAGVYQPDLFAKHILINPKTKKITIIDWQRAMILKKLTWRERINSLAALQATAFHDIDAVPSWWPPLLIAYLDECQSEGDAEEFADAIWSIARSLRQRRGIKRQLFSSKVEQELVRVQGETVCAIPDVANELAEPESIARVYDSTNNGKPVTFANGRAGVLHVGRSPAWRRLVSTIRGKSWRSTELKTARLLFHLERHDIAAPKLLGYGQVTPRFRSAKSFVIFEPLAAERMRMSNLVSALKLVSRLHDASVSVPSFGPKGEPFGVANGDVVITDIARLQLVRRLPESQLVRENEQLIEFFEDHQ